MNISGCFTTQQLLSIIVAVVLILNVWQALKPLVGIETNPGPNQNYGLNSFPKSHDEGKAYSRQFRLAKESPIPNRFKCSLKYADNYTSTTGGANVIYDYEFRLNSGFDPDLTGIGHQPLGWDQISALYARYIVTKCHYKVHVPYSSVAGTLGVAPINNAYAPTSVSQLAENKHSDTRDLGLNRSVITGDIDLATLNGVSRQIYLGDDRFAALVGASPTEIMNLHVSFISARAAMTNDWYVELIYDIEFFDPVALAQS
jgi:hypothetical protein